MLSVLSLAGCAAGQPATRSLELPQSSAAQLRYGTYEWNADDAIGRWQAGTLWTLLAAKHVDDVLLGFDDAQIAKYSTPRGTAQIDAMISQGRARGVKVELLLGDPSWILPSGYRSLETILRRLQRIDFAGVNLDLEPNEVKGYPLPTVLADLVAAIRRYVAASRWPVTLDVNYIYAQAHAARNGGYCLICGLSSAGLRHVDLMTYIADPAVVVKVDGPLLARYPQMRFAIAQSVEPPSVIPIRDSYWKDGFTRFYAEMEKLDARLQPRKNYDGIVIESMQYLETMRS